MEQGKLDWKMIRISVWQSQLIAVYKWPSLMDQRQCSSFVPENLVFQYCTFGFGVNPLYEEWFFRQSMEDLNSMLQSVHTHENLYSKLHIVGLKEAPGFKCSRPIQLPPESMLWLQCDSLSNRREQLTWSPDHKILKCKIKCNKMKAS